jgi:bacteriorhodopsin
MRAVCPHGDEELGAVSKAARASGDASRSWNVRVRDIIYVLVVVINLAPLFIYISTAIISTHELEGVDFYLWMISCALGTIFGLNALSMVQLPFRSALDRFSVLAVPFVTGGCTALEALRLFPRYAESVNGRPIFVSRHTSWLLTVPMLIIQSGRSGGYPISKLFWVAVLTNAYIVCAFSALLAPTSEKKWFWIFVTFATYSLSLHETAGVVRSCAGKQPGYVWILQGLFMVYGILYLAAATSSTSVFVEIIGFGIMDIASKGVFSTCMFNRHLEEIYKAGLLIGRFIAPKLSNAGKGEKEKQYVAYDILPEENPLKQRRRSSEAIVELSTSSPELFAIVSGTSDMVSASLHGELSRERDSGEVENCLDVEANSQDRHLGSGYDVRGYKQDPHDHPTDLTQLESIPKSCSDISLVSLPTRNAPRDLDRVVPVQIGNVEC